VICAFNGGMFGGQAVAEALFGEINPGGHLPISFPRHSGQVPVYYNYMPGWHNGKYCDLPETPLFAFGEGLSYTSFQLSNLTVDMEKRIASVAIRNTGSCSGTTVVQLYQRDLVSSILTPVKRLIHFARVTLEPGQEETVRFTLEDADFALVNTRCEYTVEPGEFKIMAGLSSKDEDLLSTSIRIL
jgi:beta-glucosidase